MIKSFLFTFLFAALLNVPAFADGAPTLAIKVDPAETLVDASKAARSLNLKGLALSDDKTAVKLNQLDDVKIPYGPEDPLFKSGPFTWMLRLKIENLLSTQMGNYALAGCWDSGSDRRSAALMLNGDKSQIGLLISPNGAADGSVGVTTGSNPPTGEWVTIVAKYDPGALLSIQLFSASGEPLEEKTVTAHVPAAFSEVGVPFLLGAPTDAGVEISNFFAWDHLLSDAEIAREVKELR